MGEVSGESSSPLLQIPSPISQTQRAGLHCQAPTQLCYLSLSLSLSYIYTHTHTHKCMETNTQNTLIPTASLFVLLSTFSLTHKCRLKTGDKLLHFFFVRFIPLSHQHTTPNTLALTHILAGGESLFSPCLPPSLYIAHTCTQRN